MLAVHTVKRLSLLASIIDAETHIKINVLFQKLSTLLQRGFLGLIDLTPPPNPLKIPVWVHTII